METAYTFEKCLGRGGYGEVYLATRSQPGGLSRRVAVKLLRRGLSEEAEALRRLRDEGRMLAVLEHPAILGVLEMVRLEGRVALVTEYVEGIDLSRCCRRGFLLPERVVLGIVGEVAAALHTAANTVSPETGKPLALIHRDIKPENIRLSRHGEVKLLDFGIARSTEMEREAETVAGTMTFTPGYAAPECFNDAVHSAASDVFSLGATLYRLLQGERLFEGQDTSKQMQLVGERDRYMRFLKTRLQRIDREEVRDLVGAMLAWDASLRPSARAVQERCEALADTLEGPTWVRWARSMELAEPPGLPAGELVGRTLEADPLDADDVRTQRMRPIVVEELPVPLDAGLSADGLPIPEDGLMTLPPGVKVPAAAEVETVVLRKSRAGRLFWPVAVTVVLLAGAGSLLVLGGAGVLWFFVGG